MGAPPTGRRPGTREQPPPRQGTPPPPRPRGDHRRLGAASWLDPPSRSNMPGGAGFATRLWRQPPRISHFGTYEGRLQPGRPSTGPPGGIPPRRACPAPRGGGPGRPPHHGERRPGSPGRPAPRGPQDPRVRGLLWLSRNVAPRRRDGGDGQGLAGPTRGPRHRPRSAGALVRGAAGADPEPRGARDHPDRPAHGPQHAAVGHHPSAGCDRRGRRPRPGGAARVRARRARLRLCDVPEWPRGARVPPRPEGGESDAAPAPRRGPPRAGRLLGVRGVAARAPQRVPHGVHDGARRRGRAVARAGSGGARLSREAHQPAGGPGEDPPLGRPVTYRDLLVVAAGVQGGLLVALLVLVLLNRWYRARRRARDHPHRLAVDRKST